MIYQLEIYYGATVDDKVAYSAVITLEDCTKPFDCEIDEKPFRNKLIKLIEKDGFSADDFKFGWVTKEQYTNRVESLNVEVITVD
jgi:hypothetical protein